MCLLNMQVKKEVFLDARDIIGYVNGNFTGDWPAITRLSDAVDEKVKKVDLKEIFECNFLLQQMHLL
jgi:hypothetical protein